MIRLKTSSVMSSAPFIVAGLASFVRVQRRTVSHAGEHQQHETNQKQPRLPSPQEIMQGFSVLELSHTTITSFAEVRKKYYELAKVHHPDAVCPPIAAVAAEHVNLTGRATNEPMKPHEQLWHPTSDPSCDKNSALRRQPSATELATDKMIRINNAFETLRRAHSAGILTTPGLDTTFGKTTTARMVRSDYPRRSLRLPMQGWYVQTRHAAPSDFCTTKQRQRCETHSSRPKRKKPPTLTAFTTKGATLKLSQGGLSQRDLMWQLGTLCSPSKASHSVSQTSQESSSTKNFTTLLGLRSMLPSLHHPLNG
ncbi:Hypothetical protein, putative [Bodo saltans]|uniref:J domain-containing protein n=1 Tax=Bodo saltans TaxID=75058 RepID=A0A0S4J274_BODSA|nr:Hypothetical protein, putative [Bodo saltans]|eukprot:CUG84280.1 Hypothetical protein, putative [Bodo saltans]